MCTWTWFCGFYLYPFAVSSIILKFCSETVKKTSRSHVKNTVLGKPCNTLSRCSDARAASKSRNQPASFVIRRSFPHATPDRSDIPISFTKVRSLWCTQREVTVLTSSLSCSSVRVRQDSARQLHRPLQACDSSSTISGKAAAIVKYPFIYCMTQTQPD